MTPDTYQRLKPLFEQAAGLPPGERAALVEKIRLEDAELGRELARMVEVHEPPDADGTLTQAFPPPGRSAAPRGDSPLMAGQLLAERFRILRPLGRGGMGEVYEAQDLHLGPVALKTIRAEMAAHPVMMARFRQEVQLARRITHPNVCRIHELFIPPADSVRDGRPAPAFLTMELLGGMTLADRISQSGPLPFAEAKTIALQLCAGLAAVHEAKVIHRDLKCRNVMLAPRNGTTQAVIMDLGLARRDSEAEDRETSLTATGAVLGTPDYMAPEQFQGETATPATDIYAMGVLLYEMVTGRRPFSSMTPLGAAMRRARPADSIVGADSGVPGPWVGAIRRCLEYDPEKRYASADELAQALGGRSVSRLRASVGGALLSPVRGMRSRVGLSLLGAVLVTAAAAGAWAGWPAIERALHPLPKKRFVAVMAWPQTGQTADAAVLGFALDSIRSRLAAAEKANPELLMMSPVDVAKFDAPNTPAGYAGALGANLVLAGSLEKEGAGERLTLTVIDAGGNIIRHAQVSVAAANLSVLPSMSIDSAARLLDVRFVPKEFRDRDELKNLSAENYRMFSHAEELMNRPNDAGVAEAIAEYQRVLDADSGFALAYAQLSFAYTKQFRKFHDEAYRNLASRNADLGIRYNPDSASAIFSHALTDMDGGNTDAALKEFATALAKDPGNPKTQVYYAFALRDLGRRSEEKFIYETLIRERPNYWTAYKELGSILYREGDYARALKAYSDGAAAAPHIADFQTNIGAMALLLHDERGAEIAYGKSLSLAPTETAYKGLGAIAFGRGEYRAAIEDYQKAHELAPKNAKTMRDLGDCYQLLGDMAKARESFELAATLMSNALKSNPTRGNDWMDLALYEAKLGHRELAQKDLDAAGNRGATDLYALFKKSQVLALLGDKEEALNLLLQCLDRNLSVTDVNLAVDLAALRSDPRYLAKVRAIISRQ